MPEILWIERVLSDRYQAQKTIPKITAKTGVEVVSGTFKPSLKLSVNKVPATLIKTTTNQ